MIQPSKRYQIFISSTFTDLKEERDEVTQAIMELGHFPYGMEAFPATNESQWEWIKKAIKESDYYIVIIGGKYGSVNPKNGISYTEMEYRYAEEVGVPTIAFLIDECVDLPKSKIENDPKKNKKLQEFRKYIETTRLRKSYTSKEDLKAKIYPSLLQLIQQYPREGWIKSDSLKNYTPSGEVLSLMKENAILRDKQMSLVQGTDTHIIKYTINKNDFWEEQLLEECHIELTWEEIFLCIADNLYKNDKSFDKSDIQKKLQNLVKHQIKPLDYALDDIVVKKSMDQILTILLQFEALKYITLSNSHDWTLTKTGRNRYISHNAIKRG